MSPKQKFLEDLTNQHARQLVEGGRHGMFSKKAFDHFLEMGLPTKKQPHYYYFPLDKLYDCTQVSLETVDKISIADKILPESLGSFLVFKNGKLDLESSNLKDVSKSIVIDSLEGGRSPYMPFVHAKLISKQKKEVDPFVLLCQSKLEGAVIIIPDSIKLSKPLQLVFLADEQETMSTSNVFVHVGKDSECDIVVTAVAGACSKMASSFDVQLEERAKLKLYRAVNDSQAMMLDSYEIACKKESHFSCFDLHVAKAPSKCHIHVIHQGENSSSQLEALAVMEEAKQYHLSTHFEHTCQSATSSQSIKTVLCQNAKASFEGLIHVHKEALYTQSYQKHATLMLGSSGISNSRPNLRVLADDVKASHGATIAELDQNALFYLKTRGIDEASGRKLLLGAFCEELLEKVTLESLKSVMQEELNLVYESKAR